jgi:RNA polymerase sigma factor (sigma-70 family)
MPSCPAPALDLSILQRALAGEAAALARVYAGYQPQVLHVAQRILQRMRVPEAPADLAAEVWLRLLDHDGRVLRAFDPARGSFHGYLKMVAWQHALAIARRWARRAWHEAARPGEDERDPVAPCAIATVHHRLLLRRILGATPGLTALDRILLEGLLDRTPMPELAPRLGLRPAALHKRSHRLRARLRATALRLEASPEPRTAAAHGPA